MFGGDAVKIASVKQVAQHPLQRLGGETLMPPGLANAIGHFYAGELVVEILAADAPDGLSHLFGHNEPLIEVVLPVATHPTLQDLSGGLWAGMDRPGEILDNLRVGGPVVKHGLGILYGSSAENEPLGLNGFGSLVDWHKISPFRVWAELKNKKSSASNLLRVWPALHLLSGNSLLGYS